MEGAEGGGEGRGDDGRGARTVAGSDEGDAGVGLETLQGCEGPAWFETWIDVGRGMGGSGTMGTGVR